MTGCQAMPQARHNPGQGGLVSLESSAPGEPGELCEPGPLSLLGKAGLKK